MMRSDKICHGLGNPGKCVVNAAGRIQVLLLLRLIGFSIMAVMGIFTSIWPKGALIVVLFLVRTGVNNAGYPIQKAVLMDYVPKVRITDIA